MSQPNVYEIRYLKDIMNYVGIVASDAEYRRPKFIPIVLPTRFGKSILAAELKKFRNVTVIDDFDKINKQHFLVNVMKSFEADINKVIVAIFTLGDDDHFSTKLAASYPSFSCSIIEEGPPRISQYYIKQTKLQLKFPDGEVKLYKINLENQCIIKKNDEIENILQIIGDLEI